MVTTTIADLLNTRLFRQNQTFLTRELGVNRNTVRKYMGDESGEFHFVRVTKGNDHDKLELFTNQTNKVV